MNIPISPELDRKMRVHVERIVRPVRAAERRKDRMREELLQHLIDAYCAEFTGSSGEAAAYGAAVARLGDSAMLTSQLQASVSRLERILFASKGTPNWFTRWVMKRPGEPLWRYAMRFAVAYMGVCAWSGAIALLGCSVCLVVSDQPLPMDRFMARADFLAWLFAAMFAVSFFVPFLTEMIRRSFWHGTMSYAGAVAACLICALLFGVMALWMLWEATERTLYWGSYLWLVPAAMVTAPILLIISARDADVRRQRYERWTSLDLTE